MAERRTVAFMSYAHFANEHDKGYLTDFCKRLSDEVELLRGEEFPIFQDREDIEWGECWKERIGDSLDNTTFLITIITPGFFKSDYCRNELRRFLEREKKLLRNDLVLPLYYVETHLLEDKSLRAEDELAEIVASHQYADWRELRFEELNSKQAKKAINKMASQICNALDRTHLSNHRETGYETETQEPSLIEPKVPVIIVDPKSEKESESISESNDDDYITKGDALCSLGKYNEAVDSYEKAVRLDPKSKRALNRKSYALHKLKKYNDALITLDKSIELDYRYAETWTLRGNSLSGLGRDDEALDCYDRAIQIDSDYQKSWLGKGYSFHKLKKYDEAIRCFDKAMKLNPGDASAWLRKGDSLAGLSNYDEAIKCDDKAIELDVRNKNALLSKGNALIRLKKYDEAIKIFNDAIIFYPKLAPAWYNKGIAHKSVGRFAEADAAFARAKELDYRG